VFLQWIFALVASLSKSEIIQKYPIGRGLHAFRDSFKRAADTVLGEDTRLDILMNNAGVMALPPGLTTDCYEI
jgi:NAD(P)-dependent dehydrogenase (short-subunit alcohol dehydrogenase family)